MKVKAAVARRRGEPLRIEGLDLAEPGDGEILVRLVASGVAAFDREAVAGRHAVALPFVPGSEGAGIVERTGAGVEAPVAGDAVLVAPARLDPAGARPDGSTPFAGEAGAVHGLFGGQSSFATHLVCRAADAVVLDRDAPLELAAALNGEVLAGAAPVLRAAGPAAGDVAVVTGAGVLGLAACMAARVVGFGSVVVADPSEERRRLALDIGATLAVPEAEGLPAVVRRMSPDGARLAVEATGAAAARAACRAALGPGGAYASVAGTRGPAAAEAAPLVARLLDALAAGDLPLAALVGFFPFEQVDDALAAGGSGAVAKPVIRFELGAFGDLDRALTEASALDEPVEEPEPEGAVPAAGDPVTA